MRFLIFLLVIFFSVSSNAQVKLYLKEYKLDWYNSSYFASQIIAGAFHGSREAYHADHRIFEKKWGVDPLSFFGSEQWKRQYIDNDPNKKHKLNAFNNLRDFNHLSKDVRRFLVVGGTFTIGIRTTKRKAHKFIDLAIGVVAYSATASLTYNYLRYW